MSKTQKTAPDALLLISTGCTHCGAVLDGLAKLTKQGRLGRLEVINLAVRPDQAQSLGIRSVPWMRIGPFELEGAQSLADLTEWAERAASGTGLGRYYGHLLESQRLDKVVEMVRGDPSSLNELLPLMDEEDTPIAVRFGIGALFEELQGEPILKDVIPQLEILTRSDNAHTRGDACHYLALTGSAEAIGPVTRLLDDETSDVREIAAESLALLKSAGDSA
jgi:hypothetical protein